MIASLNGRLEFRSGQQAIINVGGIGFSLQMSTHSLAGLGEIGHEVKVLTLLQIRDDNILLYGFLDTAERSLFEQLTSVSGVGPKFALAALSAFSPTELASIITSADITRLTTVSGIGKKTAQRIVLELKGTMELSDLDSTGNSTDADGLAEANAALIGMGFLATEASAALKGYDGKQTDISAMIRYALKRLG